MMDDFGYQVPMIILVFLWGVMAFGISPAIQQGMLLTAERYTPRAIDFASSLNISAFNLGIFLGESIGGYLVAVGQLNMAPIGGAMMALITFIPLLLLKKLRR